MPFDQERRNRFVRGVQYVSDRYRQAKDNIERQWALRDGYDSLQKFDKADFPELVDSSAKPQPLDTLSHAVGCFNVALTFSNYEKADRYFQIVHGIVEAREKSLDN